MYKRQVVPSEPEEPTEDAASVEAAVVPLVSIEVVDTVLVEALYPVAFVSGRPPANA